MGMSRPKGSKNKHCRVCKDDLDKGGMWHDPRVSVSAHTDFPDSLHTRGSGTVGYISNPSEKKECKCNCPSPLPKLPKKLKNTTFKGNYIDMIKFVFNWNAEMFRKINEIITYLESWRK